MRHLLLVSSSTTHGTGYLDHCADAARALFADAGRVLFVPHAQKDLDGYTDKARERFARLGLGLDSVHLALDPGEAVEEARGIFIGGGNTFRLLKALYDLELLAPIRRRVEAGVPYLGTSAGTNVACLSIRTTNDMPIVQPPSFAALGLVSFNVNPHYVDPEPGSTHMGETRELRIREFHEENEPPVVGLREGTMLKVEGDTVTLQGGAAARVFRRGRDAEEHPPGARLDFLLHS